MCGLCRLRDHHCVSDSTVVGRVAIFSRWMKPGFDSSPDGPSREHHVPEVHATFFLEIAGAYLTKASESRPWEGMPYRDRPGSARQLKSSGWRRCRGILHVYAARSRESASAGRRGRSVAAPPTRRTRTWRLRGRGTWLRSDGRRDVRAPRRTSWRPLREEGRRFVGISRSSAARVSVRFSRFFSPAILPAWPRARLAPVGVRAGVQQAYNADLAQRCESPMGRDRPGTPWQSPCRSWHVDTRGPRMGLTSRRTTP